MRRTRNFSKFLAFASFSLSVSQRVYAGTFECLQSARTNIFGNPNLGRKDQLFLQDTDRIFILETTRLKFVQLPRGGIPIAGVLVRNERLALTFRQDGNLASALYEIPFKTENFRETNSRLPRPEGRAAAISKLNELVERELRSHLSRIEKIPYTLPAYLTAENGKWARINSISAHESELIQYAELLNTDLPTVQRACADFLASRPALKKEFDAADEKLKIESSDKLRAALANVLKDYPLYQNPKNH